MRACLENLSWVAQAPSLCRRATCPTERSRLGGNIQALDSLLHPRHSGRQVADRGGLVARATQFSNRFLEKEMFL